MQKYRTPDRYENSNLQNVILFPQKGYFLASNPRLLFESAVVITVLYTYVIPLPNPFVCLRMRQKGTGKGQGRAPQYHLFLHVQAC